MRDVVIDGKTYSIGDDGYGNVVIGKPLTDEEFRKWLPPHNGWRRLLVKVSADGPADGVKPYHLGNFLTRATGAGLILAVLAVITLLIIWPIPTLAGILIVSVFTGLSVAAL